MTTVGHHSAVTAVLEDLRSPAGSLASGAAAALVLSLAVECLALASAVSARGTSDSDTAEYHKVLHARLVSWREDAARAFVDDPKSFGRVLATRADRDAASPNERTPHVEREVEALVEATRGLVDLLHICLAVEEEADALTDGYCRTSVLGDAATAGALARGSNEALRKMVGSNLHAIHRRIEDYGVIAPLDPLRESVERLPSGSEKSALVASLGVI